MKKTLRFLQIILHKKCITIGTIFVDILNNSFIDIQIKRAQKKQIITEMYLVINYI